MGQGRLELPTPSLSEKCSNRLSYWPLHITEKFNQLSSQLKNRLIFRKMYFFITNYEILNAELKFRIECVIKNYLKQIKTIIIVMKLLNN